MLFDENKIIGIVDSFISVYGEKYREIITNKINNCLILLCGYKNKEERTKIKDKINIKYLELLYKKIKEIINLSMNEINFLFGQNVFKNDDLIGVFSSTSQSILDIVEKTRVMKINAQNILKIREDFSRISSQNISPKIADELIKIYDDIVRQAKSELFLKTINFEENKDKISKYSFLEDPVFDLESYDFEEQQHNGVQPNFIKDKDGNVILFPIINFATEKNSLAKMFNSPDYFDVLLIHEINHVIGMHLLDYENKGNYRIQMGLIESDAGNNKTNYFYMATIDEVFNQYIAKKVTNDLHSKGIYLLDNSRNSQVNDSSLYEMSEFLLTDFFSIFYNELLEIYATGINLESFYANLDTNALKELGTLIKDYLQKVSVEDIPDQENMEYIKKTKEIILNIEQSSYKQKIYEVVQLLDLNDLEHLTFDNISLAYESMLEKLNLQNNDSLFATETKELLKSSLNYAQNNIDLIKNIKGISTNASLARMYQQQKSDLLKIINGKNPLILKMLVDELVKAGFNLTKIIKFLNSLEYGLVFQDISRKIAEIFGEYFYNSLIELQENKPKDYNKFQMLLNQLEESVLTYNKSPFKNIL